MVSQDDKYPEFPVLQCQVCEEKFELPRRWLTTPTMGNQIFIDWKAGDALMEFHSQSHIDTLVQEVEAHLRASVS